MKKSHLFIFISLLFSSSVALAAPAPANTCVMKYMIGTAWFGYNATINVYLCTATKSSSSNSYSTSCTTSPSSKITVTNSLYGGTLTNPSTSEQTFVCDDSGEAKTLYSIKLSTQWGTFYSPWVNLTSTENTQTWMFNAQSTSNGTGDWCVSQMCPIDAPPSSS